MTNILEIAKNKYIQIVKLKILKLMKFTIEFIRTIYLVIDQPKVIFQKTKTIEKYQ
mgnify:FL=1